MSGGSDSISVAVDALPLAGSPTGVGVFCENLCRQLAGRGDVELHAYAVSSQPDLVRRRLPAGTPLKTVRMPTRAVNASWLHGGPPSGKSLAGGCSVLHGTNYVVPPARRIARVVTVHDMTAWRFPELCSPATLAYPGLLRQALSTGAFVHAVSRFTAAELIELTGADESRVRVVHSAPSPSPSPSPSPPSPGAEAEPLAYRPDRPYILAVGTVEPRKDYPTLVRAVAELAVQVPEVELVIAGSPGWG
ncbi:MAG TPA: glycosyltransferase, partial [Acidimicrobiales bacterium]|nr:glycosyltransferase [Acidimicrobiales bacterium]